MGFRDLSACNSIVLKPKHLCQVHTLPTNLPTSDQPAPCFSRFESRKARSQCLLKTVDVIHQGLGSLFVNHVQGRLVGLQGGASSARFE